MKFILWPYYSNSVICKLFYYYIYKILVFMLPHLDVILKYEVIMMLKNTKGIIFDMDGTLVDSMWLWESIDRKILNKRNIKPPEDLKESIQTMSFYEVAKYFKTRFDLPESPEQIQKECYETCVYEYSTNIPLKHGAKEFLLLLKQKNIKIGLATSNYRELTELNLKKNKVYHLFDAITTISEVKRSKSFPDIFLLTAKKLNLHPKDCIVFEDILSAVKGAKTAGMTVVGVYDFYSDYQWDDMVKNCAMCILKYKDLTEGSIKFSCLNELLNII